MGSNRDYCIAYTNGDIDSLRRRFFSLHHVLLECFLHHVYSTSIVVFIFVILCGASPFHNVIRTMLVSLHLSTMAFGFIHPKEYSPNNNVKARLDTLHRVVMCDSIEGGSLIQDQLDRSIAYSTIGTTIPFTILSILDHGRQIQRWPMPLLMGSSLGYGTGS